MSDVEEWRAIAGYEGFYEVSSHGNVRGCRRTVGALDNGTKVIKPKPMKLTPMTFGHLTVEFHRDNKRRRFLVHRLVLTAFKGPCPDGMEGCHANGIPDDNRLSNLYWGTHSDNMRDAVDHGTHRWSSRTKCERGHDFTPENTRPRSSNTGRECLKCAAIWHERKNASRRLRRAAAR